MTNHIDARMLVVAGRAGFGTGKQHFMITIFGRNQNILRCGCVQEMDIMAGSKKVGYVKEQCNPSKKGHNYTILIGIQKIYSVGKL